MAETSSGPGRSNFNIPKINKHAFKDNLQPVDVKNREIQNLLRDICKECLDTDFDKKFEVLETFLIHNALLQSNYVQKKADMKDEGRNAQSLVDQYAFLCPQPRDRMKLVRDGLTVKSLKYNRLGKSEYGVYLNRFLDIEMKKAWRINENEPKEMFVFKYVPGRCKALCLGNVYSPEPGREPTPNFDSHVSNVPPKISDSPFLQLAKSSIYLYEYTEDCVPSKQPRQCLPYAIIKIKKREDPRGLSVMSRSLSGMSVAPGVKNTSLKGSPLATGVPQPPSIPVCVPSAQNTNISTIASYSKQSSPPSKFIPVSKNISNHKPTDVRQSLPPSGQSLPLSGNPHYDSSNNQAPQLASADPRLRKEGKEVDLKITAKLIDPMPLSITSSTFRKGNRVDPRLARHTSIDTPSNRDPRLANPPLSAPIVSSHNPFSIQQTFSATDHRKMVLNGDEKKSKHDSGVSIARQQNISNTHNKLSANSRTADTREIKKKLCISEYKRLKSKEQQQAQKHASSEDETLTFQYGVCNERLKPDKHRASLPSPLYSTDSTSLSAKNEKYSSKEVNKVYQPENKVLPSPGENELMSTDESCDRHSLSNFQRNNRASVTQKHQSPLPENLSHNATPIPCYSHLKIKNSSPLPSSSNESTKSSSPVKQNTSPNKKTFLPLPVFNDDGTVSSVLRGFVDGTVKEIPSPEANRQRDTHIRKDSSKTVRKLEAETKCEHETLGQCEPVLSTSFENSRDINKRLDSSGIKITSDDIDSLSAPRDRLIDDGGGKYNLSDQQDVRNTFQKLESENTDEPSTSENLSKNYYHSTNKDPISLIHNFSKQESIDISLPCQEGATPNLEISGGQSPSVVHEKTVSNLLKAFQKANVTRIKSKLDSDEISDSESLKESDMLNSDDNSRLNGTMEQPACDGNSGEYDCHEGSPDQGMSYSIRSSYRSKVPVSPLKLIPCLVSDDDFSPSKSHQNITKQLRNIQNNGCPTGTTHLQQNLQTQYESGIEAKRPSAKSNNKASASSQETGTHTDKILIQQEVPRTSSASCVANIQEVKTCSSHVIPSVSEPDLPERTQKSQRKSGHRTKENMRPMSKKKYGNRPLPRSFPVSDLGIEFYLTALSDMAFQPSIVLVDYKEAIEDNYSQQNCEICNQFLTSAVLDLEGVTSECADEKHTASCPGKDRDAHSKQTKSISNSQLEDDALNISKKPPDSRQPKRKGKIATPDSDKEKLVGKCRLSKPTSEGQKVLGVAESPVLSDAFQNSNLSNSKTVLKMGRKRDSSSTDSKGKKKDRNDGSKTTSHRHLTLASKSPSHFTDESSIAGEKRTKENSYQTGKDETTVRQQVKKLGDRNQKKDLNQNNIKVKKGASKTKAKEKVNPQDNSKDLNKDYSKDLSEDSAKDLSEDNAKDLSQENSKKIRAVKKHEPLNGVKLLKASTENLSSCSPSLHSKGQQLNKDLNGRKELQSGKENPLISVSSGSSRLKNRSGSAPTECNTPEKPYSQSKSNSQKSVNFDLEQPVIVSPDSEYRKVSGSPRPSHETSLAELRKRPKSDDSVLSSSESSLLAVKERKSIEASTSQSSEPQNKNLQTSDLLQSMSSIQKDSQKNDNVKDQVDNYGLKSQDATVTNSCQDKMNKKLNPPKENCQPSIQMEKAKKLDDSKHIKSALKENSSKNSTGVLLNGFQNSSALSNTSSSKELSRETLADEVSKVTSVVAFPLDSPNVLPQNISCPQNNSGKSSHETHNQHDPKLSKSEVVKVSQNSKLSESNLKAIGKTSEQMLHQKDHLTQMKEKMRTPHILPTESASEDCQNKTDVTSKNNSEESLLRYLKKPRKEMMEDLDTHANVKVFLEKVKEKTEQKKQMDKEILAFQQEINTLSTAVSDTEAKNQGGIQGDQEKYTKAPSSSGISEPSEVQNSSLAFRGEDLVGVKENVAQSTSINITAVTVLPNQKENVQEKLVDQTTKSFAKESPESHPGSSCNEKSGSDTSLALTSSKNLTSSGSANHSSQGNNINKSKTEAANNVSGPHINKNPNCPLMSQTYNSEITQNGTYFGNKLYTDQPFGDVDLRQRNLTAPTTPVGLPFQNAIVPPMHHQFQQLNQRMQHQFHMGENQNLPRPVSQFCRAQPFFQHHSMQPFQQIYNQGLGQPFQQPPNKNSYNFQHMAYSDSRQNFQQMPYENNQQFHGNNYFSKTQQSCQQMPVGSMQQQMSFPHLQQLQELQTPKNEHLKEMAFSQASTLTGFNKNNHQNIQQPSPNMSQNSQQRNESKEIEIERQTTSASQHQQNLCAKTWDAPAVIHTTSSSESSTSVENVLTIQNETGDGKLLAASVKKSASSTSELWAAYKYSSSTASNQTGSNSIIEDQMASTAAVKIPGGNLEQTGNISAVPDQMKKAIVTPKQTAVTGNTWKSTENKDAGSKHIVENNIPKPVEQCSNNSHSLTYPRQAFASDIVAALQGKKPTFEEGKGSVKTAEKSRFWESNKTLKPNTIPGLDCVDSTSESLDTNTLSATVGRGDSLSLRSGEERDRDLNKLKVSYRCKVTTTTDITAWNPSSLLTNSSTSKESDIENKCRLILKAASSKPQHLPVISKTRNSFQPQNTEEESSGDDLVGVPLVIRKPQPLTLNITVPDKQVLGTDQLSEELNRLSSDLSRSRSNNAQEESEKLEHSTKDNGIVQPSYNSLAQPGTRQAAFNGAVNNDLANPMQMLEALNKTDQEPKQHSDADSLFRQLSNTIKKATMAPSAGHNNEPLYDVLKKLEEKMAGRIKTTEQVVTGQNLRNCEEMRKSTLTEVAKVGHDSQQQQQQQQQHSGISLTSHGRTKQNSPEKKESAGASISKSSRRSRSSSSRSSRSRSRSRSRTSRSYTSVTYTCTSRSKSRSDSCRHGKERSYSPRPRRKRSNSLSPCRNYRRSPSRGRGVSKSIDPYPWFADRFRKGSDHKSSYSSSQSRSPKRLRRYPFSSNSRSRSRSRRRRRSWSASRTSRSLSRSTSDRSRSRSRSRKRRSRSRGGCSSNCSSPWHKRQRYRRTSPSSRSSLSSRGRSCHSRRRSRSRSSARRYRHRRRSRSRSLGSHWTRSSTDFSDRESRKEGLKNSSSKNKGRLKSFWPNKRGHPDAGKCVDLTNQDSDTTDGEKSKSLTTVAPSSSLSTLPSHATISVQSEGKVYLSDVPMAALDYARMTILHQINDLGEKDSSENLQQVGNEGIADDIPSKKQDGLSSKQKQPTTTVRPNQDEAGEGQVCDSIITISDSEQKKRQLSIEGQTNGAASKERTYVGATGTVNDKAHRPIDSKRLQGPSRQNRRLSLHQRGMGLKDNLVITVSSDSDSGPSRKRKQQEKEKFEQDRLKNPFKYTGVDSEMQSSVILKTIKLPESSPDNKNSHKETDFVITRLEKEQNPQQSDQSDSLAGKFKRTKDALPEGKSLEVSISLSSNEHRRIVQSISSTGKDNLDSDETGESMKKNSASRQRDDYTLPGKVESSRHLQPAEEADDSLMRKFHEIEKLGDSCLKRKRTDEDMLAQGMNPESPAVRGIGDKYKQSRERPWLQDRTGSPSLSNDKENRRNQKHSGPEGRHSPRWTTQGRSSSPYRSSTGTYSNRKQSPPPYSRRWGQRKRSPPPPFRYGRKRLRNSTQNSWSLSSRYSRSPNEVERLTSDARDFRSTNRRSGSPKRYNKGFDSPSVQDRYEPVSPNENGGYDFDSPEKRFRSPVKEIDKDLYYHSSYGMSQKQSSSWADNFFPKRREDSKSQHPLDLFTQVTSKSKDDPVMDLDYYTSKRRKFDESTEIYFKRSTFSRRQDLPTKTIKVKHKLDLFEAIGQTDTRSVVLKSKETAASPNPNLTNYSHLLQKYHADRSLVAEKPILGEENVTVNRLIISMLGISLKEQHHHKLPYSVDTVLNKPDLSDETRNEMIKSTLGSCAKLLNIPDTRLSDIRVEPRAIKFGNPPLPIPLQEFSDQQVLLEVNVIKQCQKIAEQQRHGSPVLLGEELPDVLKVSTDSFHFADPEGTISPEDATDIIESLELIAGDILELYKCENFGRAHCRVPELLLLEEEKNHLYTKGCCFLILSSSIPRTVFTRLLTLKRKLEKLTKTKGTVVGKEVDELIAERSTVLKQWTGNVNKKRLRKLTLLHNRYQVCLDYIRNVVGLDGFKQLPLLDSFVAATTWHFQVLRAEVAHPTHPDY